MKQKDSFEKQEVFSKRLRAGRRTYFLDVKQTRAGDYYLIVTESKKKQNEDGTFDYEKHKIFLYKEDLANFQECLREVSAFVLEEKK